MIMTWVATQKFAQSSRCFVVNTTLSSKTRHAWRYYDDDSDSDEDDEVAPEHKDKALSYTPAFGTHNFWYKGRLLQFRRTLSKEQANYNVTEVSLIAWRSAFAVFVTSSVSLTSDPLLRDGLTHLALAV